MSEPPMRRQTVRARDGFGLAVQVSGRPHGPALLLFSGQANSHVWWSELRAGFDDRFQVVSFDWRGTGHSRGAVQGWTTASFAQDAVDVLDALDVPSAAVYGTSMGGRVAQMLAADFPHRVDRLVLACTSPGGRHARERGRDVRRALADPDPAARSRVLQELFYTDAWLNRQPRPASPLFGDPTMSPAEARAHLSVSARHDAWDRLPDVVAPTLVLHGSDDRMVPASNAPLIAGRIPGAVSDIYPGGRHGFFAEFADEVTSRVRSFLIAAG